MANSLSDHSLLVLGIETSCDETAAAVVRDGRENAEECQVPRVIVDHHREHSSVDRLLLQGAADPTRLQIPRQLAIAG